MATKQRQRQSQWWPDSYINGWWQHQLKWWWRQWRQNEDGNSNDGNKQQGCWRFHNHCHHLISCSLYGLLCLHLLPLLIYLLLPTPAPTSMMPCRWQQNFNGNGSSEMLMQQAVGMLESMTIPGLLPSPHWQAFVICFPTPLPSPMHSTPMHSHQRQQQQQHSPAPALSLVGIAAAGTFVCTRNCSQPFGTNPSLPPSSSDALNYLATHNSFISWPFQPQQLIATVNKSRHIAGNAGAKCDGLNACASSTQMDPHMKQPPLPLCVSPSGDSAFASVPAISAATAASIWHDVCHDGSFGRFAQRLCPWCSGLCCCGPMPLDTVVLVFVLWSPALLLLATRMIAKTNNAMTKTMTTNQQPQQQQLATAAATIAAATATTTTTNRWLQQQHPMTEAATINNKRGNNQQWTWQPTINTAAETVTTNNAMTVIVTTTATINKNNQLTTAAATSDDSSSNKWRPQ